VNKREFFVQLRRTQKELKLQWFFALGSLRTIVPRESQPGSKVHACLCPISAVLLFMHGESADHFLAARRLGISVALRTLISEAADCRISNLQPAQRVMRRQLLSAVGR
jgi:hypothetical protein